MVSAGLPLLAALLFTVFGPSPAHATTIDFESLQHGEIVDTQFVSTFGVTISAINEGGGPDLAAAFDSLLTGTADPDLEGPPWSGGNLAPSTELGRLLIIAENDRDRNHDGVLDSPDDEGSRPAGSLFFEFEVPITSFGFDLIDVEGPEEYGDMSGFMAVFYDGDDNPLAQVGFGEFVDSSSPFFAPDVTFGNKTANRIAPITAEMLDLEEFHKVELNLGGSSAVDNITFEPVPEPTTLVLLALGLAGLSSLRRSPRA
jgi:hypothetical protein